MAVRTNILLKLSNFVDSVITFAKLQNIATNKILGRITAGSGVIEELDIANYSNKLIPLTTTFANAENTSSEIDIVTVTVPANSLAVGDLINIEYGGTMKQNSGVGIAGATTLRINATTVATANNTINNATQTRYYMQKQKYLVTAISGNNITIRLPFASSTLIIAESVSIAPYTTTTANGSSSLYELGSIDKTSIITLKVSSQWATADVNAWIRVEQAQAYIIKKAV
jgi:hypothetical protein